MDSHEKARIVIQLEKLERYFNQRKAKVLTKATPTFIFNEEKNLFEPKYSDFTVELLKKIDQEYCVELEKIVKKLDIKVERHLCVDCARLNTKECPNFIECYDNPNRPYFKSNLDKEIDL